MRRLLQNALLSATFFIPGSPAPSTPQLSAVRAVALRAEYLVDPLAIDVRIPRLSWIIEAGTQRGVPQTAFPIEVASTAATPAAEKADLRRPGKTPSTPPHQLQ